MRDWLERIVLSWFDPDEREDIRRDVRELAADRRGVRRSAYYWLELLKYPGRRAWDAVRYRRSDRRRERGRGGMESLLKDTRYAVRALIRNPGFTVMAIAITTVSMGAATAIFSVVDGVLLEPLPVEEPDRLVSVWLEGDDGTRRRMTPGNFTDVSELDRVFTDVAAFGAESTSLATDAEPVFLRGSRVTPAYFEALGVQPILGRTFRVDEGELGGPSVVVISHHVWQQHFGGDPSITRRTIELDGAFVQVVGVVPPGVYPTQATVSAELPFTTTNQDFFVPLTYGSEGWANRRSHVLGMIGRLAPGVDAETAHDRLASLSERLRAEEPMNANEHFLMTSFTDEVVGDVRFGLLTLLGTVGLVLFIAVVNVGALFVLRADDRRPELAIRTALGAPRARLIRQMLLESTVIAALASISAIFVANLAIDVMRGLVPYQIPRMADVTVDGTALLLTVVGGALVASTFGLVPALKLRKAGWTGRVGVGRQTSGVRQRRLQGSVVAIQAGLCVVVLVGAALLSRSYRELRAVDTGFEARDAWAMSILAPLETLQEIVLGIREIPGVAAVALAYDHPLERNWGDSFIIEGVERSASDAPTSASLRPFGDDYFGAAGIEVVEGRVPDALDMAGEVGYAVVNEALSEMFFPGRSPLGERITLPTAQRMLGTDGAFEISAVVRDVRFLGPDEPVSPALYVPLSHFPVGASTLVVRPAGDQTTILPAVRQVVAGIDSSLGVQQAQRLGDILDDLLARPRFNMMLLVSFGLIGLILCGLGAYGLVGRVVAMRVREIGIQMALGADRSRLARSVMGSAVRPMLVGGAVGMVAAFGLSRLIQSLLFGISPSDPLSFAVSPGFVLLVGTLAALVPTLRAISIDPARTLREE